MGSNPVAYPVSVFEYLATSVGVTGWLSNNLPALDPFLPTTHLDRALERSAKCPECPFYAIAGLDKGTPGGDDGLLCLRVPLFNFSHLDLALRGGCDAVSASVTPFVTLFYSLLALLPPGVPDRGG